MTNGHGFVQPIPSLDALPYAAAALVMGCGHIQHVWITQVRGAPVYRWVMPELQLMEAVQ